MFDPGEGRREFQPFDFDTIAEWGFDFVRLPCSYRFWADPDPARWREIDDGVLSRYLDPAIELGRDRRIHVSLNLHRVPGYCVSPPAEARDLWTDPTALDAAVVHWTHLARRYRGIPSSALTFDLINEPPDDITPDQYLTVHRALISAIHAVDPSRVVVADGLDYGKQPVAGLAGSGAATSTRGYSPLELSHFRAPWIEGSTGCPTPSWPLPVDGQPAWDRDRLRREVIEPFRQLQTRGVGVHVGEFGAYQLTPARRHAALDDRPAGPVAGSRLGLVAVEPARQFRGARQRARRRQLRRLPRAPVGPADLELLRNG
jgi:endoglucanase